MKKNLLIAIAAAGLMYSCGGVEESTSEELKAGADKICNCMADKIAKRGEINEDLLESTIMADYTVCAFNVAVDDIDVASDKFTSAIAESCPDYNEAQAKYVKIMNED